MDRQRTGTTMLFRAGKQALAFSWLLLLANAFPSPAASVDTTKLPPAASRTVDFAKDIQPIFEASCIQCHGPDKQKSGFRLDQKEAALKGGETYAPDIHPGKSSESPLIHFVAG